MTSLNPYSPPNPQPVEAPPLMAQLSTDVEGMTVEFEQTLDDILALQYHVSRAIGNKPPGRWSWVLFGTIEALMLLMAGGLALDPQLREAAFVPLVGFVVIGLCIGLIAGAPALSRWLVRRAVLKLVGRTPNLNLTGLRRVTISPQFLVWASPVTQAISRWIGVEKVLVEADCLFIFVSAMSAYVLPRRAFNSEQHFREYAAAADRYRQQGFA